MAKLTKEMEYNEFAKFGECFMQTNNYGGYGIVVNDDGRFYGVLTYHQATGTQRKDGRI